MRLIDADMLEPSEVYMDYGFTRIVYMDDIDEMPAVDPVKHGHWDDRSVAFYRKCSECGCCMEWDKKPFLHGDGEYNYCPNCGAKMDEVKDE